MQVSQGNSVAPAEGPYLPPARNRVVEEPPIESPAEMVQGPGKSLAPAEGAHEPSPLIGSPVGRSQTGAASDYGTAFDQSNGEVDVPAGRMNALPMEWASKAMHNSQPEYGYRPTLFVGIRLPQLIYRPGNARRAGPGPESQGPQYPPAPGLPLGERRPGIVPPSDTGRFVGEPVTRKIARRLFGPKVRKPKTKARPNAMFSPGSRHGVRRMGR